MARTVTEVPTPVVITDCGECGWGASTGAPMCSHAQEAQAAADKEFDNQLARLNRRTKTTPQKREKKPDPNEILWACEWCGIPRDDVGGKPEVYYCPSCQDGHKQVVQMTRQQSEDRLAKNRS